MVSSLFLFLEINSTTRSFSSLDADSIRYNGVEQIDVLVKNAKVKMLGHRDMNDTDWSCQ